MILLEAEGKNLPAQMKIGNKRIFFSQLLFFLYERALVRSQLHFESSLAASSKNRIAFTRKEHPLTIQHQ
jgi:hypothetical protein